MFKPLLRTIPTYSGNVKLACTLSDYTSEGNDVYVANVRGAQMLPLSSSLFQRNLPVSLLSSSWEFDLPKFYDKYSDIFYGSEFHKSEKEMQKYDISTVMHQRNDDFEYGVKRVSFQKSGNQYACFAPIYIDSVTDLPSAFVIEASVKVSGKKSIKKTIRVNISDESRSDFNHLYKYLERYVSKFGSDVARMDADNKAVIFYGIDVKNGGFAKKVDQTLANIYQVSMPMQMFDTDIATGYSRNRLAMKQCLPLAFYFSLDDCFTDEEKQKCTFKEATFSAYYVGKDGGAIEWNDFSWDYDTYTDDVLKLDQKTGEVSYSAGHSDNIMDAVFPAFHEKHLIDYQFSNKLTAMYSRWKMRYSDDEHPYIANMSWAFSDNQNSNYKYKEFPVAFLSQSAYCTVNENKYDLQLPLGTSKALYDSINPKSSEKYKNIFDNYCLSWFEVLNYKTDSEKETALKCLSDMFVPTDDGHAYFNGVLYDLRSEGADVDRFALFVHPDISSIQTIESANSSLVFADQVVTENGTAYDAILSESSDDGAQTYVSPLEIGKDPNGYTTVNALSDSASAIIGMITEKPAGDDIDEVSDLIDRIGPDESYDQNTAAEAIFLYRDNKKIDNRLLAWFESRIIDARMLLPIYVASKFEYVAANGADVNRLCMYKPSTKEYEAGTDRYDTESVDSPWKNLFFANATVRCAHPEDLAITAKDAEEIAKDVAAYYNAHKNLTGNSKLAPADVGALIDDIIRHAKESVQTSDSIKYKYYSTLMHDDDEYGKDVVVPFSDFDYFLGSSIPSGFVNDFETKDNGILWVHPFNLDKLEDVNMTGKTRKEFYAKVLDDIYLGKIADGTLGSSLYKGCKVCEYSADKVAVRHILTPVSKTDYKDLRFDRETKAFYKEGTPDEKFLLFEKAEFYRLDDSLYKGWMNLDSADSSKYKDMYVFRPLKDEEYDEKFSQVTGIDAVAKDSFSTDATNFLYPCFNDTYWQKKDDTLLYLNIVVNNIRPVTAERADGSTYENYRYACNDFNVLVPAPSTVGEGVKKYTIYGSADKVSVRSGASGSQLQTFKGDDGLAYGYYEITVKMDNTKDTFDMRGFADTDYSTDYASDFDSIGSLRYITMVDGHDITSEDGQAYLLGEFRRLCPFMKANLLTGLASINTVIKPATVHLNTFYTILEASSDPEVKELNIYYSKKNDNYLKKQILQRYATDIVPLIRPLEDGTIPDQYALKYKCTDAALVESGKYNSIGDSVIYNRSDISPVKVSEYSPIRVYSLSDDEKVKSYNNGKDAEIAPAEYKHFNCSKMYVLPEYIEIPVGKKLDYESMLEHESPENTYLAFAAYVRKYAIKSIVESDILFLYKKYVASYDSTSVGVNYDGTKKLYRLTYKFTLL